MEEDIREYKRYGFICLVPLSLCCCYGWVDFVQYLLKEGALVEWENNEAIKIAKFEGHEKIVEILKHSVKKNNKKEMK